MENLSKALPNYLQILENKRKPKFKLCKKIKIEFYNLIMISLVFDIYPKNNT